MGIFGIIWVFNIAVNTYNFCEKCANILKNNKKEIMADPNKYKSVSVPIETYKLLDLLSNHNLVEAKLTISSTLEILAKKEAKKLGLIKSK